MQEMDKDGTHKGPAQANRTVVEFVVLRHEDREGTHYDLMIDLGVTLATWKCARPPETAQESPIACRRIGDHRRVYLEYEGPISGDRGKVRRHDRGTCEAMTPSADRWQVLFHGQRLSGSFELYRVADDSWQLRRE